MKRNEIIQILENIDDDPRNGTTEENMKLLTRLQKTANQSRHVGWYPTVTQIKMCMNCVYRAFGSYESGYCAYTDVTGKTNGIRQHGYCTVYEMDPKRIEKEMSKELYLELEKTNTNKPRVKKKGR